MHVWQPPQLESTVGKRVVVSAVSGPDDISQPLKEQLIASAPSDAGRAVSIIDAAKLPRNETIQLVSAVDVESNDLATASLSRSAGADYVLRGEVLPHRGATGEVDVEMPLRVSWRLLSLHGEGSASGMPIVVDQESLLDRYPDLGFVPNPNDQLVTGAVRDTFRLLSPWIDRQTVTLSIPYGLPGSRDVRRGIAAARGGRWGEAESIWTSVRVRHPTNVSALHNLALAAAAAQDFSRAKQLARRSIRLSPTSLHKKTLVWIELMQRDYHEAFGLPDPPEGWFIAKRR
ncbi:MAG: hypothetical protein AAGG48_28375 [Planctomycetota bacterium]